MPSRSFAFSLFRAGLVFLVCTAPLVAERPPAAVASSPSPLYAPTAVLPRVINGRPVGSLIFDRTGHRLYAGTDRGLFWADLTQDKPIFVGPVFKGFVRKVEVAPDLGRVFFATFDLVGYVDVRDLSTPHTIAEMHPEDVVYEPSRHEIYVTSRDPNVRVFDARTGESSGTIDLPGWNGSELEAIPGAVFLGVSSKDGLYKIDAATHTLMPFATDAKLATPFRLEADPAGKYLFASYYQHIVAIEPATGRILGRATTQNAPSIAYDAGSDVLIATWDNEPPPIKVVVFRMDASGLSPLTQLQNPAKGRVGVEPTNRGFLQFAAREIIVWAMTPS